MSGGDSPPAGPLAGLLVLDLSRVLAGPSCTMILGDLGARVLKVEKPGEGDITRSWGPPFAADGESAYYQSVNRNKESVAIDLSTDGGRRAVEILAARADVLVENFPPGVLDRLGIGVDGLRAANPRLIVATVTGYGSAGPDRGQPGFDLLAQAGGGLMAITGEPDGPATKVGVAVSDLAAGANLAIGILAALHRRERTGQGAHVEVDLFSSTLALLPNVVQAGLATGREAGRHGSGHAQIVPYQLFEASDEPFIVAVGTDRQFRALCKRVLGRPEWAEDPRFASNAARVENRQILIREIAAILRTLPRSRWLAKCRTAGVPAGPVRGPLEALRTPQADALGLVRDAGGIPTLASPIRLSGASRSPTRPPRLGQHTEAIWKEFGLP